MTKNFVDVLFQKEILLLNEKEIERRRRTREQSKTLRGSKVFINIFKLLYFCLA